MSRITRTGADWLAPPAPTTAWQRERMQPPRETVRGALRRGTVGDWALTVGWGAAFVSAVVLWGAFA